MRGVPPRVGLIGCGLWGRNILRDLRAEGADPLVADPTPAARDLAFHLGASCTVPFLDDLPEVDGLIVATPASTHAAVVEQALERGVPVFVEKPLTTDAASADRLAARGADRLFAMHVFRYHHGVEALAGIAQTGELGPVVTLRSTRTHWGTPRTDVDSIWTLVPHDLTIALAILGQLPPRAARLLK